MTTHVLPLVRFVEDDEVFRTSQELLLRTHGYEVQGYAGAAQFLAEDDLSRPGCIVLDVRMPGMTGLELQRLLNEKAVDVPVIFLSGHGDIAMAVHTMQSGAVSFLEKPVAPRKLLESIAAAVEVSMSRWRAGEEARRNQAVFESLTPREREVVLLAARDTPNKVIARALDIAEATVKMHRANAFAKLGVKSPLEAYVALERLGVIAGDAKERGDTGPAQGEAR